MPAKSFTRADLEGRIDGFLLKRLDPKTDRFPMERFVPTPTWNRFDLGFKLLFTDALRSQETDFARRIYAEHIKAFSLGDMVEPGNDEKSGVDRFFHDFSDIYTQMQRKGFDESLSLLPLAWDGSPINGGHRTACALSLGVPVTAVKTGLEPVRFDHRFFETRGMTHHDLDAAALRMVKDMPYAAVALLWPAARGKMREVEDLIGPIVYRRTLNLSLTAGHTLLTRVYANEPWLGDPAENYPGVRRKLMECFSGTDDLRLLVFDAPPEVDRVRIKDRIRQIYGIAKSSVHMTDTHDETIEILQMLLNANARDFLEVAQPMKFSQTRENIAILQNYLSANAISAEAVAADTGMVMGAYGLRAPSDIDVVAAKPLPDGPIERHDGRYHDADVPELLQDPARHFHFCKIKFVSLSDVKKLKSKRLAGRDREDLLLIRPMLSAPSERRSSQGLAIRLRFLHLRLRRRLIRVLFAIGIGPFVQRLYRRTVRR